MGINLTVNYNFLPDRVVSLYEKFNGMDGEAIVEGRVQNSIIAYVKEVTPRFSVMDIYSDKKSEVNKAITDYLNEKLSTEYGINVSSALIIDVELDSALQERYGQKSRPSRMQRSQNLPNRRRKRRQKQIALSLNLRLL